MNTSTAIPSNDLFRAASVSNMSEPSDHKTSFAFVIFWFLRGSRQGLGSGASYVEDEFGVEYIPL